MIDAITDPANIIMVVSFVGTVVTIMMFFAPVLSDSNLSSRLKRVAKRREELSAAIQQRNAPNPSQLRMTQSKGLVKGLVERFRLVNPTESEDIRDMLSQAGVRGLAPLYTYAFFRFVMPIILGIGAAIYLFVFYAGDWGLWVRLGIVAGAIVVGFYLPMVFVKNMVSKRQKAISKGFPNSLDLMVICVEAGLSMEAGFNRVAAEIQEESPELSEEIFLTTAELSFLPDRALALEGFAKRTGLQSVKSLVTSLAQSEKYGTPVSVALRVISQEQRDERMSKAEKKAGALPAQLTVPMIVFFLPVLFVVILGPAVLKTLATLSK